MRDLRNEMYASATIEEDKDNFGKTIPGYVTREEFNRKIKELEAKIRLLEAKINSSNGWDNK